MATNCTINGHKYYKINRKIGLKRSGSGAWIDDYKCFYGKNKADAERKYKDYLSSKDLDNILFKPLGYVIELWIKEVLSSSSLAPTTQLLYRSVYFRLMADSSIAAKPLLDVTPIMLQSFYNSLEAPYSQVKALHKSVRRFYKYMAGNYHIPDITTGIEIKNGAQIVDLRAFNNVSVWNINELKKVLDNLNGERFALLIILAVNTGARIGELLALEYTDIKNKQLYISKQTNELTTSEISVRAPKSINSYRVIPLSDSTLKAFEIHRHWHEAEQLRNGYQTNYIFTTNSGRLYCTRNIYRALDRYYKRIGVTRHRFHDFRHTFATMLSENGIPIEVASSLLGHSSINVTAKYYIGISDQRKSAAINQLAEMFRY